MAGAGYKLFQTGDVLTAAQVNTYLNEQTVMVFASAAARTSALTSVLAEGMVSYLQDTNAVEVYNGTAWVGVSGAGDVTEVQAGVGISVASGTGPIPIVTNTVATAFDAAGDLVYGTGADTFAKLSLGTAGKVLTVNSGATAPEWATPAASGGFTLLSTTTLAALSTTISGISGSYKHLLLYSKTITDTAAGGGFLSLRFNSDTGSNYSKTSVRNLNNTVAGLRDLSQTSVVINSRLQTTSSVTKLGSNAVYIYRYTDTDHIDFYYTSYGHTTTGTETCYETGYGQYDAAAAITSITILGDTSLAGTVYLYGLS
jgi:hypothetical protein